jgi:2,3-bisphosphoglycerate-independent phosphoglycerate mutase
MVRPVTLLILDGWGYAPPSERNALSRANTPHYDEICRTYPRAVLATSRAGSPTNNAVGNAEAGHLTIGTGRTARTPASAIQNALASGEFLENEVLNEAFRRAKENSRPVHLVGMLSDGGVHSSTESLFGLLRLAKQHGLTEVYLHCILDGLDVPPRTADVYVEALEIKLADIGVGRIASLCGRFFAMDSSGNWERTARAYTMLVHGEGERARDAVGAIRNSFLRGISDEFISPIVLEREMDVPVARVETDDLVVFFNHRPDTMRQLVRALSVPDHTTSAKPLVETVCLTEFDPAFNLPVAFRQEPERNTLSQVLAEQEIANVKVTETSRIRHLTYFFDGATDTQQSLGEQILVPSRTSSLRFGYPESESFKVADKLMRRLDVSSKGLFVANLPAAGMMAESGDMDRTVAAVQFVDTCLGGICEKVRGMGGVLMITSSDGSCEEMPELEDGERAAAATGNPVPFHFIDFGNGHVRLRDSGTLEDVAPTILSALGIEKPAEMSGEDLRSS